MEEVSDLETLEEPERSPTGRTPMDCKHERTSGYVYRYTVDKGCGYLRSKHYDGDLFFRREEVMHEYGNHRFALGERVEFTIHSDDQEHQHAVLLKPMIDRTAFQCLGNRYRGYIRRFAERWGFLNSAAFDGDLFVHRDNLLPQPEYHGEKEGIREMNAGLLHPRQEVEFDVMLDERGRAVAKYITMRVPSQPSDWLGLRVRGHIRSFQDRWGFLNSDRFTGDLFIHRDGLMSQFQSGTLGPGTIVEFDVEMDNHRSRGPRNRLVARNVVVLQLPNGESPGAFHSWPREQVQNYYSSPAPSSYSSGGQGGMMDNSYHSSYQSQSPHHQHTHTQQYQGSLWSSQHQQQGAGAGGAFYSNQATGAGGSALSGLQSVQESKEEDWEWSGGMDTKGVTTHITIKDWEADGQGQLRARKGQLVTVSHEAPHGWVYGTHLRLPDEKVDKVEEGWIPKVMVKRVTLCQAVCDWPGEGSGSTTLSVRKNEWVAISREAERGWVYGDRVITETNSTLGGGWIPKKILL